MSTPTETLYPCADCGKTRTKDEGGTTFAVCGECWEKRYGEKPTESEILAERIRAALTDEILDEIDDVALEAANHTRGVWDEVAYWKAWREGIAKKVVG